MRRLSVSTKKMAYAAMLTAMCVVVNIFDINLVYFKISIVALPCFIAGAFLGPVYGFTVGILGDLLGYMLNSGGFPYMPLIGIASGLLGFIPGVVFQYVKLNDYLKIGISYTLCLIICTIGINTFALWSILFRDTRTLLGFFMTRMIYQPIISLANVALAFALYAPLKKFVFKPLWDGPQKKCESDIDIKSETDINIKAETDTNKAIQ